MSKIAKLAAVLVASFFLWSCDASEVSGVEAFDQVQAPEQQAGLSQANTKSSGVPIFDIEDDGTESFPNYGTLFYEQRVTATYEPDFFGVGYYVINATASNAGTFFIGGSSKIRCQTFLFLPNGDKVEVEDQTVFNQDTYTASLPVFPPAIPAGIGTVDIERSCTHTIYVQGSRQKYSTFVQGVLTIPRS